MNTLSANLGFILFFSLIIWVFLVNDLYLKIFFLKVNKQKRKNITIEKSESLIFEQVYGGKTVPQYIRDSILKSQDKYQLLSLYLASKSIIDIGIYNKVVKNSAISKYQFCVSIFVQSNHIVFNWAVWIARVISIVGCLILCFIFFDEVFLSKNHVVSNSEQFVVFSILGMFLLMPYSIYSPIKFFNKLCSLFVLLSSILVSLFTVIYIQNYSGELIFNKFFLSMFLTLLIILVGSYSYIGYSKLEYLVNFFELLEANKKNQVVTNDQSYALAA